MHKWTKYNYPHGSPTVPQVNNPIGMLHVYAYVYRQDDQSVSNACLIYHNKKDK